MSTLARNAALRWDRKVSVGVQGEKEATSIFFTFCPSLPHRPEQRGGKEGGRGHSREDLRIQRAQGVQSLHVHPVREGVRESSGFMPACLCPLLHQSPLGWPRTSLPLPALHNNPRGRTPCPSDKRPKSEASLGQRTW